MEITGNTQAAGLPLGVLVAGSGLGAVAISWWTRHVGRRAALAAGYLVGVAGALTTVAAVGMHSFSLVLLGSAAQGVANAAVFLTRYAAADHPGTVHSGGTIGLVLAAAATGAVAGPNLLGPAGALAQAAGLPHVAGLYVVAAPSFGVAAMLLTRSHQSATVELRPPIRPAADRAIPNGSPAPRRALLVLGAANLAMVATMAIAPVHMVRHGHGLTIVGIVVSIHVFGMFAAAPLWGRLGDAVGHSVVMTVGAGLITLAGLIAAVSNVAHGGVMISVLAMLGLGWSAGVVGASALLTESVPAAVRPRAEAMGEVAMSVAAGGGAPLAGLLVAAGGFAALGLAMAVVGIGAMAAGLPRGEHSEAASWRVTPTDVGRAG
ncbi:MAG TPA: MFS transporter [Jiangellaceae bacterium]|nr:MFS transporter [Jiangellaceae bacterium]